jgi:hypothetical protein
MQGCHSHYHLRCWQSRVRAAADLETSFKLLATSHGAKAAMVHRDIRDFDCLIPGCTGFLTSLSVEGLRNDGTWHPRQWLWTQKLR